MTVEVVEQKEIDQVHAWRVQELTRAGCPDSLAAWLAAEPTVDLHQAVVMLEAGCPPELVERILL